jgi:electron transfer flavoprotein beta subunit
MVICGTESTDARMSVVPAMLAERLNFAQLTFASSVKVDGSNVSIARQTEFGVEQMQAPMPVVVSVVEKINEPRYPSFKGIMAAKKKPLETKSLGDIGVSTQSSWSVVKDSAVRPPRSAGIKITDEGDGGTKLVAFLQERRVI